MALHNFELLDKASRSADTIAILADALGDTTLPAHRRVPAALLSKSPEEGLALLRGYICIEDRKVRQAILDAVLAISGLDPYC